MKDKIKIIIIVIICITAFNKLNAQEFIKTVPVFKKQANYDFTNEWQYISTDLYLFNANKFNIGANSNLFE